MESEESETTTEQEQEQEQQQPANPLHLSRRDAMPIISEQFWSNIIPERAHDVFLPKSIYKQLLEDEEVQIVIYQAWYRNFSTYILYNYSAIIIVIALMASAAIWYFGSPFGLGPIAGLFLPFIVIAIWAFYAIFENFRYLQWRLILTNNRLIFATPQKDAWYLVDNIEMNGKPNVIDTNWSDNQWWRLIQMIYGARDVFISLQGLQFVPGSAKVKDALVMPDVELDKVEDLKQFIFSG